MNRTIVACFRFLSNNRKYSELNVRTVTSELITRSLVAGAVLVVLLLLSVFRSEAVGWWLTVILWGVWWRSLSDRFTLTQANRINSIGYTENDDHTDPTKARAWSAKSQLTVTNHTKVCETVTCRYFQIKQTFCNCFHGHTRVDLRSTALRCAFERSRSCTQAATM